MNPVTLLDQCVFAQLTRINMDVTCDKMYFFIVIYIVTA